MRAALVLLLCACASSPRPVTVTVSPDEPTRREGARHARDLVEEIQASLRRGDVDGLYAVVDPSILVIGPRAADVYASRTDALMALRGALAPGRPHRISARATLVGASASGRSAWMAGDLVIDGVPLRVSAVLAEVDGIWSASVVHVARPVAEAAAERLAQRKLPAGASLLGGPGADPPRELLARFEEGVATPGRLVQQLAERREGVLVGADVARGPAALKRQSKKGLLGTARMAVRGRPRAGVTADGRLGWVAAELDLASPGGASVPARALLLYEPDGAWRLAAMHWSVPDR